MKNINKETCKWMRIGNGDLVPFSDEVPNVTKGNVKIKYYLKSQLESLNGEFEGNDYIKSIDLSKLDVSKITDYANMAKDCVSLKTLTLNEDMRLDADYTDIIKANVILENVTDDLKGAIKPIEFVSSIPNKDTIILSNKNSDGIYEFKAVDTNGISVDVILSNWDNYNAFVEEKDPENPELPYFLNTQHCKELGVPSEDKFISKSNKNSIVTDPRVCLADNDIINIHIPDGVEVDYIVAHISGHNGAASELDYVYDNEDGIYMDATKIIPASEGTTDLKIWFRDKRSDYKFYNGTLENNKKVWASFEFYKINNESKRIEFPEVTKVNPPIDDSIYVEFEQIGEPVSTGVNALSGICLAEDKSCLYGVSDTYGLYKINFDGTSELLYDTQANKGDKETEFDLEGLTMDENGDLFACVENDQQIVKFAKPLFNTAEVVSNVDADKLKETMTEFNNGFEGIAYNNGTFYLGNQFKPISVTNYSLTEGIGESIVLGFDNTLGGTTEVGDLQYDPTTNTLWVIDSRSSNIYNYDLSGNVIASYKTNIGSKPNTESFVIDFENNKLYVACDNTEGSLYTFDFIAQEVKTPLEKLTEYLLSDSEAEFNIDDDITITESLEVNGKKTINLNGHKLSNSETVPMFALNKEGDSVIFVTTTGLTWSALTQGTTSLEGYQVKWNAETKTLNLYKLTEGDKLQQFLQSGSGEYQLNEDALSTGFIQYVDNLTIDLNGHSILSSAKNAKSDVKLITVNGKTLTIKDSVGTGKVDVTSYDNKTQQCVYVTGNGTLNIEGGSFISKGANSCIFSQNSTVNISGGSFETGEADNGVHYVINCLDNDSSSINITGGSFKNFDPAKPMTEPDKEVSFLAEGFISTENEGIFTVIKA